MQELCTVKGFKIAVCPDLTLETDTGHIAGSNCNSYGGNSFLF